MQEEDAAADLEGNPEKAAAAARALASEAAAAVAKQRRSAIPVQQGFFTHDDEGSQSGGDTEQENDEEEQHNEEEESSSGSDNNDDELELNETGSGNVSKRDQCTCNLDCIQVRRRSCCKDPFPNMYTECACRGQKVHLLPVRKITTMEGTVMGMERMAFLGKQ